MASADYISREAVVNAINSTPFTMSMFLNEDQCVGARQARDSLALIVKKSIPAADVRPVVLCRDCKWYQIDELKKDGTEDRRYKPSVCVLAEQRRDPNHFCADGAKREES